jgi:hypothetical protein
MTDDHIGQDPFEDDSHVHDELVEQCLLEFEDGNSDYSDHDDYEGINPFEKDYGWQDSCEEEYYNYDD